MADIAISVTSKHMQGAECTLMQTHLPGYVADFEKLRKAGCKVIACMSVNDTFVMKAWGELHGAPGKVSFRVWGLGAQRRLVRVPESAQLTSASFFRAHLTDSCLDGAAMVSYAAANAHWVAGLQ